MKEEIKTVSVLLTKYTDPFSKLFSIFTRSEYTHASIGIGDNGCEFFSFVLKDGFHIERPIRNKKAKRDWILCALYQLDVSYTVYNNIKLYLQEFLNNAEHYQYSFFGVPLCLMRIPHHFKYHYFCSQFVAQLIIATKAAQLKKRPSIYLPDDFQREPELKLCFKGTLGELAALM